MKFKKGERIIWKWVGRNISGVVVQSFTIPVEREIKGSLIKRNSSPKNPAYLVRSDAGNEALKLETELIKAPPMPNKTNKPKMFKD